MFEEELFSETNLMRDVNRSMLRRYVILAMIARGLLSETMIDSHSEKTFTMRIYGDEIGYRYGERVMYANEQDVKLLIDFLESKVAEKYGAERMSILKRSIQKSVPDEVEKIGIEWLQKWQSDEDWPLT